jgi:CheY-like chemotaxis protein
MLRVLTKSTVLGASVPVTPPYLTSSGVTMMPRSHVLFVDDDVLNQWLVTDSLSAHGFTVTGLCRGAEAVKLLKEGHDFDLLMTDLHMPDGMTGFELADHWRRAQPGRPILYTSTISQIATGLLEDDEGFIRKHAASSDLMAVVYTLLSGTLSGVVPTTVRRAYYVH